MDKKKIWNVVRKTCIERRKINLLKMKISGNVIEKKVIELVDFGTPNFWGHFRGWDCRGM